MLRDVPGVFPHDPAAPDVAAIVLTHSHLDHYGLAHHAHPAIPVYGSDGTISMLEVGRVFFPDATLPSDLRRLPLDEPLRFGGLTVTAIPVDHAAPDSRALLVEADGQQLLYTGDLRAHGRTGFRFEKLLSDERVHGVDWLLVEGTTRGSSGGTHGLSSEADVEEQLLELASGKPGRLVCVAASGQNLDRLVSLLPCGEAERPRARHRRLSGLRADAARAALGEHPAVHLGRRAREVRPPPGRAPQGGRPDGPRARDERAREGVDGRAGCASRRLPHVLAGQLRRDEAVRPHRCGVGRPRLVDVARLLGAQGGMREWAERRGVEPHFVHSGGHAWPEDLDRLVRALAPKHRTWVHTDYDGEAEKA